MMLFEGNLTAQKSDLTTATAQQPKDFYSCLIRTYVDSDKLLNEPFIGWDFKFDSSQLKDADHPLHMTIGGAKKNHVFKLKIFESYQSVECKNAAGCLVIELRDRPTDNFILRTQTARKSSFFTAAGRLPNPFKIGKFQHVVAELYCLNEPQKEVQLDPNQGSK